MGSATNLGMSLYNTSIQSSGTAINMNSQKYENMHWFGGFCSGNQVCFSNTGGAGDYHFHSVSFDGNNATSGSAFAIGNDVAIFCDNCHFENPGGGATSNYIQASGNAVVYLNGGVMLDDKSSGGTNSNGFINFAGSMLEVDGTYASSGCVPPPHGSCTPETVNPAVYAPSAPVAMQVRLINASPKYIPAQVNSVNTRVLDIPLRGDTAQPQATISNYAFALKNSRWQFTDQGTAALSSGSASISFATAYANAPLVFCTDTAATAAACNATGISTTGATLKGSGTDTVQWIAFGN